MGIRPEAIAFHKDGTIYKTDNQKAFYGSQKDNELYLSDMNEYQKTAILKCKEVVNNGGIVIWDTDIDGFRISNLTDEVEVRTSFKKHEKELKSLFLNCGITIEIKEYSNEPEHTSLIVMNEKFDLFDY